MTDVFSCHYCQRILGKKLWEYRPRPQDPLLVFCTPTCRDEYVDGYGLTPADWLDAPWRVAG